MMVKKMLKNILNKYKIMKFIIVGGSSTCIDFIIYMILSIKIDISISKSISMVISCMYSFILNRNWTFDNKDTSIMIQLPIYIGSQIINIIVNVLTNKVMYIVTENKIISYIIATICAMIINYILQKKIVFREKKDENINNSTML